MKIGCLFFENKTPQTSILDSSRENKIIQYWNLANRSHRNYKYISKVCGWNFWLEICDSYSYNDVIILYWRYVDLICYLVTLKSLLLCTLRKKKQTLSSIRYYYIRCQLRMCSFHSIDSNVLINFEEKKIIICFFSFSFSVPRFIFVVDVFIVISKC